MNVGPPQSDRPSLPGVRSIVAVASGKGGVGKSTVAANLAVALGMAGASVGLLDADIYGPNIPTMMGVRDKPEVENDAILPLRAHGVKLMSMGLVTGERMPVIWRGPLLTKMIQQFLFQVSWGNLDILVLDLPPGTGDVQITIRQSVHITGAVIVTTPQALAVEDVRRGILMFQQVEVPVLGIVENMNAFVCPRCSARTAIFGTGGGRRMAEQFGMPLLGEIPIDPLVRSAGDDGVPVVKAHPESPVSESFRQIAATILERVNDLSGERLELEKLNAGLKLIS